MNEELEEKIEKLENRVQELENYIYTEGNDLSTLDEKVDSLANKMDLEVEDLKSIFDFEKDQPYLIKDLPGSKNIEKQHKFVTMYLTVLKYCYNQEKIKSSKLKEIAEDKEFMDTHFGNNIKNYTPYIRTMGKRRGTKYKITHPGTKKGMDFIKKLVEGEE